MAFARLENADLGGLLAHTGERMLLFAAHPDDETIGAGGHLSRWPNLRIVHATDGAPLNMLAARTYGFTTREAYAQARRQELLQALRLAGIGSERTIELGFGDQQCAYRLTDLTRAVAALFDKVLPQTVLAPAYEGGHPDHDSLAFAVHLACRLCGTAAPRIVEYTLYHSRKGCIQTAAFVPAAVHEVAVQLNPSSAALKQRMIECFVTQRATLAPFTSLCERFRRAPYYNFTALPNAGDLYYAFFNWGITGPQWLAQARLAACELGITLSRAFSA